MATQLPPSNHAIIALGNTDRDFDFVPSPQSVDAGMSWRETLSPSLNDVAIVASGDIYRLMNWLGSIPGLFSSRVLMLNQQHDVTPRHDLKTRRHHHPLSHGLLLFDGMSGKDEAVLHALSGLEEITALYTSRGVYGITATVMYSDEQVLRENVNLVPGIRHAALLPLSSQLSLPAIVHEPQAITSSHYTGSNRNERQYQYDKEVNVSYADGCGEMARHVADLLFSPSAMVYVPLRGAKPIVDGMLEAYRRLQQARGDVIDYFSPAVVYPVTSSFVSYTDCHPYMTKNGKMPASGRTTHRLEIQRLREHHFDDASGHHLVYLDEIISGGMMVGHVKEMVDSREGIIHDLVHDGVVRLSVAGLSHAHGSTFREPNKRYLSSLHEEELLEFGAFPVQDLVTEDRKALLGIHYLKNELGPHSIPFVGSSREYHSSRAEFWRDIVGRMNEKIGAL